MKLFHDIKHRSYLDRPIQLLFQTCLNKASIYRNKTSPCITYGTWTSYVHTVLRKQLVKNTT